MKDENKNEKKKFFRNNLTKSEQTRIQIVTAWIVVGIVIIIQLIMEFFK